MPRVEPSCSFCGKALRDVGKLIAAPGVHICDGCVVLSVELLLEESRGKTKDLQLRAEVAQLEQADADRQELRRVLWHAEHPDARRAALIARHLEKACAEALDLPRPVAERARALAEELEALARR